MDITQVVQVVGQFGAVGLLALLVWQIPRIWKEWQQAREKELDRWVAERTADRLAREETRRAYQLLADKFTEKMSVEGQKNREMFTSEIKYERQAANGMMDKVLAADKERTDLIVAAHKSLLKATEEQTAVLKNK